MQYNKKLKVNRSKFRISMVNRYTGFRKKKMYKSRYMNQDVLLNNRLVLFYIILAVFLICNTSSASLVSRTNIIDCNKTEFVVDTSSINESIDNQLPISTTSNIISDTTYDTDEIEPENIEYEAIEDIVIEEEIDIQKLLEDQIGNSIINLDNTYTLNRYDLPDVYYPGIDFSSFQPYMSYDCITNKSSGAYKICNSDEAYSDEYGFRRYRTNDDEFTIDGQDDYIVALGTFYKPKGEVGSRYLITTTTGMYTVRTGDEKSDLHTDEMHMFSRHGNYAGLIEWIVDDNNLIKSIKRSGTVTQGPVIPLQGKLQIFIE